MGEIGARTSRSRKSIVIRTLRSPAWPGRRSETNASRQLHETVSLMEAILIEPRGLGYLHTYVGVVK